MFMSIKAFKFILLSTWFISKAYAPIHQNDFL